MSPSTTLLCSNIFSEIIDCVLFSFEKGVGRVVSFNTFDEKLQLNRGCYFPMQTTCMLSEDFPLSQFNLYTKTMHLF